MCISFVHFIHIDSYILINEPIRNSYVAQKMYFPDGDAMSDVQEERSPGARTQEVRGL